MTRKQRREHKAGNVRRWKLCRELQKPSFGSLRLKIPAIKHGFSLQGPK